MNSWGGSRPGAGRPKGSKNATSKIRRQNRTLTAFADEWEYIKAYARYLKKEPEKAKMIIDDMLND